MRRLIAVPVAAVLALVICLAPSAAASSLLWNPGPKYWASQTLTITSNPASEGGCLAARTDFSENHLVGNPSSTLPPTVCEYQTPVPNNTSAPTYYTSAFVGWTSAEFSQYPGWDVWRLSGGNGSPITSRFLNHSNTAADPCVLREVGYSFENWPTEAHSHFKFHPAGRRYKLGDFSGVAAEFQAKRDYSFGPPKCATYPTGDVSADFRVKYEDSAGNLVRYDILGVVIDVMPGTGDLNGNPNDEVFYDGGEVPYGGTRTKLLYGDRLGHPSLSSSGFQFWSIEYKDLLRRYLPPPAGFSIDDASITGFDLYTSARGADLDLDVRAVDVSGSGPSVEDGGVS